ncbi:MAG: Bacillopeptidase F [Calditrichaeota bacterium]|nr:Bacillopeptidase F [Calditrichota bacterium]
MSRCLSAVLVILLAGITAAGISAQRSAPGLAGDSVIDAYKRWDSGQSLSRPDISLLRAHGDLLDRGAVRDDPGRHAAGPDGFGYAYRDSYEPDGPAYSWVDISGTGAEIAAGFGLGDEDVVGPFPIGFDFPFYGGLVDQFWVQSNGVISFFPAFVLPVNHPIPYQNYGAMVAWFWDDLDPDNGEDSGPVYYETRDVGGVRALVVSLLDQDEYPGGPNQDRISAQVLLLEDGRIRFQYASVDDGFDIAGGTIGIQGAGGEYGSCYLCDGDPAGVPAAGLAVEFERAPPNAVLTGLVVDTTNASVIAGAEVAVGSAQAVTGENGRFLFPPRHPGDGIPLVVKAEGYHVLHTEVDVSPGLNQYVLALKPFDAPLDRTYLSSFEVNRGVLTPRLGNENWSYGEPTSNPPGAHTPPRAWVTGLNGNYANNSSDWLVTRKPFLLQQGAFLRYWHWYDIEADWDGYNVKLTLDGGETWLLLVPEAGYSDQDGIPANGWQPCFNNAGGGGQWEQVTFDLSQYAGERVWLGFHFVSDPFLAFPGVCIDDLEIHVDEPFEGFALYSEAQVDLVPPYGGEVSFYCTLLSPLQQPYTTDAWTAARLPNGSFSGTIQLTEFTLHPGLTTTPVLTVAVPDTAPAGEYRMFARIGFYPCWTAAQGSFPFVKQSDRSLRPAGWGLPAAPAAEVRAERAGAGSLRVWPNPFNAAATVAFDLPARGRLAVSLHDITGREVRVLADREFAPGSHQIEVNGADLPSGLYLLHLSGESGLNETRKLLHVK